MGCAGGRENAILTHDHFTPLPRGTLRRLGPPVGRDATELARSAICRAGPLTSRGTRPPIVHDRIQDHHHPRTTTTKCGGSIAQHDRVPSTDRLNGDVPDVRPLVCVCAATRLRHTGRGSARDLLFSAGDHGLRSMLCDPRGAPAEWSDSAHLDAGAMIEAGVFYKRN